jgi:ABC-type polysaccharide/polyol phosphate export permease
MKLKIFLTVVGLLVWNWAVKGIGYSADIITKNTLVVDTVNGGNSALIAQNTYNAVPFNWIGLIAFIVFLLIVWGNSIKSLMKQID